jgi:CheY-specific phosphatase CheX
VTVSANDLARIVRTIWSTQLGLELEGGDPETLERGLADRETIMVGVKFSGGFSGTLVQRCSQKVSVVAASAAFTTNEGKLGSTDARDVLAELAHVTAGNLKSILPGQSELSLPITIESDEDMGSLVTEVGFELQGEPLIVRLTQQQA